MIDLEIRCTTCDRVPATLRLNGATLCRTCAHALIDRVSPAPRPRPTPEELAETALALITASDRPMNTDRLRQALRVRYELAEATCALLEARGQIARTYVGRRCLGWTTPSRAVASSSPAPMLVAAFA